MLKNIFILFSVALAAAFHQLTFHDANAEEAMLQVDTISVIGAKRFTNDTAIEYSKVKTGNIKKDIIASAVSNIMASGLYKDVTLEMQNNALTFKVIEQPIIFDVVFDGNVDLHEISFKKFIKIGAGQIYSDKAVHEAVDIIRGFYISKGYYNIVVRPQIINIDDSRVRIVFKIQENAIRYIKKINIVNNTVFSDKEIKAVMLSKEKKNMPFGNDATLNILKKEVDIENIKDKYRNAGYNDVSVADFVIDYSEKLKGFIINVVIEEGEQYLFGKINIDCEDQSQIAQIMQKIMIKEGEVFNKSKVKAAKDIINDYVQTEIGSFANTEVRSAVDNQNKIINLSFIVRDIKSRYINNIAIINNSRTKDNVIRRSISVSEGDKYTKNAEMKIKREIKNLGYFSNVTAKSVVSDDDKHVDLFLDVSEKSTGSLIFSSEYTIKESMMLNANISEENFGGTGKEVDFGIKYGPKAKSIDISLVEANFRDRNMTLSFDGSLRHTSTYVDSDKIKEERGRSIKAAIAGIKSGYSPKEYWYHTIGYSIKSQNTKLKGRFSEFIEAYNPKCTASSVTNSIVRNTSGNSIYPKEGSRVHFSQEFALFGGSNKYIKNTVGAEKYFLLNSEKDVVFKIAGSGGYVTSISRTGGLRKDDAFDIGGDDIAGFKPGGISPRDKNTGDSLGGTKYYTVSAACMMPLFEQSVVSVIGIAFLEGASAFGVEKPKNATNLNSSMYNESDDIRLSAGVGFAFQIPMLGMVRVDYALPIKKKDHDLPKKVRIALGVSRL